MHAEDVGGPRRQRTIDKDRQAGQLAGVDELMQIIGDGLRTAEAECGDDDLAAAVHGALHDEAKLVCQLFHGRMSLATVGAFGDEQLARRYGLRIAQDR